VTPPRRAGFFIAFEGIDRCGKSTQVESLCAALLSQGLPVGYAGVPGGSLREPGGTPTGEALRDLLLHRRHAIDPWTEALLYAAARAQLVADVIRPSLAEGQIVICDRYIDSSLAYQGHARNLGIDRVRDLNLWATGGLLPDLTVLVELSPELAATRAGGVAADRIEREGLELQRRVAEGYALLVAAERQRFVVVDGSAAVVEVAAAIQRRVLEALEVTCVR
jgi:dTMP kinase